VVWHHPPMRGLAAGGLLDDCARAAAAIFTHELESATDCWRVEVTGERSHGGGLVARFPDGTLKPYW